MMINFDDARQRAIEYIAQFYSVQFKNGQLICFLPIETWEEIKEIPVIIEFPKTFPLQLASILPHPSIKELNRSLPHIASTICTLDTVTNIPVPEQAHLVLRGQLQKASEMLARNPATVQQYEYDDEFLHYWGHQYGKKFPEGGVLSLVWDDEPNNIIFYKSSILLWKKYSLVVASKGIGDDRLKAIADVEGAVLTEFSALFLGELPIDLRPPFFETNRDTVEYVQATGKIEQYERHVNRDGIPYAFFIRKVPDRKLILGWKYNRPERPSKGGYREDYPKFNLFKDNYGHSPVTRIYTDEYSPSRQLFRSAGTTQTQANHQSFLIAGLGSIGSHVTDQLLTYQPSSLTLVDPEDLRIENVARHLLGVPDHLSKKVKAMRAYIIRKRPEIRVEAIEKDLVEAYKDNLDAVNEFDYSFIATGDLNSTHWIAQAIREGLWTSPTFFFWVEPHLAGGHCLFINPSKLSSALDLLEETTSTFSVIDPASTQNFAIADRGCNATFIPYSEANLKLFLYSIYSRIHETLSGSKLESKRWTWIGNLEYLHEVGVPINPEYSGESSYAIKESII